jgi:hypothetical protein
VVVVGGEELVVGGGEVVVGGGVVVVGGGGALVVGGGGGGGGGDPVPAYAEMLNTEPAANSRNDAPTNPKKPLVFNLPPHVRPAGTAMHRELRLAHRA